MGPVKTHGNGTAPRQPLAKTLARRRMGGGFVLLPLLCWLSLGCSFDYGAGAEEDDNQPDIVMNDVAYVRIRDGDPVVRFEAESAERYENRQTMELRNFSFEQYDTSGEEVNAVGSAGAALVELESGNIKMQGGVRIAVDSEDLTIETTSLSWQDKERLLSGAESGQVDIQRSDGTNFSGRGFSADVRSRTWAFTSGVEGAYVHTDEDEDAGGEADEAAEDAAAEAGE
jgi:LPS export ABC transporter protein LptC